jgi:hypothetical protein
MHTLFAAQYLLLAIDPITLTFGGVGVVALIAWLGRRKPKKKGPTVVSKCPPFPALDLDAVKDAVGVGIEQGVKGMMPMTSFVAYRIHPEYPDGTAAKWPKEPPYVFGVDFDGAAVCRWEEIRGALEELDIPEVIDDPLDVISDLILDYPLPGHFYQIKPGDNLSTLVRSALNAEVAGAGQNNQSRLNYMKLCMNVGTKWNKLLYGSSRTSNVFPAMYLTNGSGLAAAFLPRHANVLQAVANKQMPKRTILPNGNKIAGAEGSSHALLWFPPISKDDLAQNGIVTCAPFNWDDGTSTIDPPPQLLNLLT